LRAANDRLEARVRERTTELARANHAMRASEGRLAGIVNSAMDAIISVDREQRIIVFNAAAETLFRCSAASAIGHPIDMFIPQRVRERHRHHVDSFARTGITARSMGSLMALTALRADGEEFPIEASISQIEVDGQGIFTVILRDISERLRVEESRARLVAIVESSDDAIAGKDLNGVVTSWNKGAEALFGYSAREMVGESVTRLIPAERHVEEDEILRRIRSGERVLHFETVRMHKDGRLLDVSVTVSPITDSTGRVIGASTVMRDITERKRAEELLRNSELRFRALIENSHEAIAVLDVSGARPYVSPTIERVLGYTAEEYFQTKIADVIHPDDLPAARAFRARILAHPGTTDVVISRIRHKDGTWRWIETTGTSLLEVPGLSGIALNLRDVTERKHAEDALRQSTAQVQQLNAELEDRVTERTAQLEAANKELESFSYSVSHDLRAPLRSIDGFSQAVQEDYGPQLPEEGRRYLATIRGSAQRMGELIDDLLTFSRLSRQPLRKRAVDMGKLAREVLEELSAERQGRDVEVRVADLCVCQGDPALLKQVWVNLLSNALKYTRRRAAARVEIGCQRDNGTSVYFVRDNGTGFDMQYADKLFGVFQRLHRAEEFEGTGVGLAVVQRIVHRHGGRVWAEAAVDHGASFYFTLEGDAKS
jgi:PAS domain S-box-containing protein